ncbi:MAG TPA: amino acid adenylation domain-containing protein, partial [Longimicrobium sp.]|nr:amino acid adenylation domain-containing protein [Longimicrobium sp.]
LERLQALGRSEGATLYMTLLGAFQVLLSKYSGSEDIVVGSPIAGRTRGEVEELIGFFVNTLVLRTDLSGDPSFRETLRGVREATLGAYEHQEVPFEKLVAELQPERSLSHSPLFQVMFTLQNAEGGGGALPGLKVGGVGAAMEIAKFDLSLTLAATPQGLRGGLNYSTALFERSTVDSMLGHLARVLEQVAVDADVRLSQLELLGEAERALVLEEWNRTETEYPADQCIHELFEAQAARTPGAGAVVFEEESLTYRELNARSNRLAHHLRALGVGPDARVALCVERGVEMVVAMLAVPKAGGAYVPLDPAYPDERLRYMLADSRPAVLLASPSQAARFAAAGVPVLDPANEAAWAHLPATDPRPAGLSPDHLCYVIYTSGSTGRPKGVTVPHRGVVSLLADVQRRAPIGEGDGCSLWTSTSFDVSVYEIFSALLAGGRLCIPRDEVRLEAGAFLDWMEAREVRSAYLPPYFLSELRDRVSKSPDRTRLHRLLVGVEPIPEPLLAEIRRSVPGLRIINGYGPTEATICATLHDVPDTARGERVTPIGAPAANARVFLLDARMRPVPIGVVGEMYVGGVGVARGYLDRPALTAERFVPDPLSGEPGARLYRTGDLGRWLPEGALAFAGRTDAQVKVRGYRVEPGEIEAALLEHEGVRECAVLVREDAGEKRVVAYVVGDVETDALRAHVRHRLPEYMVPGALVFLEALPLTPNGKLDRKALPAPEYGADADRYVAPRTPVEEVLARIWAEVLKVERVGVTESFFELGGHSLLALRLFGRVRRELGCDLAVATLFVGGTVRHMAEAVRAHGEPAAAPEAAPLVPLRATGTLPPLFVVHMAGRRVSNYAALVKHLGSDQPVYGLQDVGDDLARPVERIAGEHLRAMRAVQPHGPYHLAGWSFGGVVAYEMAVQLERAGERVTFAGVLDAVAPPFFRNYKEPDDADMVLGLARGIAAQMGRPFTLSADPLTGAGLGEQLRRAVEALHAQGAAPDGFDAADLRAHLEVIRARNRAMAAYRPGAYGGPFTLFAAADHPEDFASSFGLRTAEEARTYGWCRLAPAVRAHRVPGGHNTIGLEPHVETLAARVREELAAARAGEVGV